MRTDRVVVNPPAFDDNLGFFQRVEQLAVEQLIAHLPVDQAAVRTDRSTGSGRSPDTLDARTPGAP